MKQEDIRIRRDMGPTRHRSLGNMHRDGHKADRHDRDLRIRHGLPVIAPAPFWKSLGKRRSAVKVDEVQE